MQLEKLGFKPTNALIEKSKSAGFSIDSDKKRHIAISCVTTNTVTCYINFCSVNGEKYPTEDIEGIERKNLYPRGHKGTNGNPGISGSIARNNPSLDPSSNDVLRVHIASENSLNKLLRWYCGNVA
jgi:hypothetical protein